MDQVVEGRVIRGQLTAPDAEAKARALFRALALPDPRRIGARYPHQVSGGQLQRADGRDGADDRPGAGVLDEPTTALDVTTQVEVLRAFQRRSGTRHHRRLCLARPGRGRADGRPHRRAARRPRCRRAGRTARSCARPPPPLHPEPARRRARRRRPPRRRRRRPPPRCWKLRGSSPAMAAPAACRAVLRDVDLALAAGRRARRDRRIRLRQKHPRPRAGRPAARRARHRPAGRPGAGPRRRATARASNCAASRSSSNPPTPR